MSARIEAVLFDLGGVLIEVVGAERMLHWCPALPDIETLWRRWLESPSVRSYETGNATRADFARAVIAEFALPVEPEAFLDEFARWPRRLFDDALPLLAALKPRFTLASLSNTNELHWERFSRDWNLPAHFHANFPSYAVGRLKPDADYFEHVLRHARRRAGTRTVHRRQRGQCRRGRAARNRRSARARSAGGARGSCGVEAGRLKSVDSASGLYTPRLNVASAAPAATNRPPKVRFITRM